jgi:hypothetical protein
MIAPAGRGLGDLAIAPKESPPGTGRIPERKTYRFGPGTSDYKADPAGGILKLIKGTDFGINDKVGKHGKRMNYEL